MRVVLVSTHVDQTTGYSKVASNLLKQLSTIAPKVKVFHYGFQRHPSRSGLRKAPDGIVQYDAAANEDPKEEGFGFNKISEYLEMVQPELVIIYNDPLVIYKFIESMKHEKEKSPYKLWIYLDQVYDGIAQPLVDKINTHADRIYCFTEEWKQRYLKYGTAPDTRVLEHAVDPSIFTNMSANERKNIRFQMNIPADATIFLNANRNSQRKRLDLTIAGFVRFIARNPSEQYYLVIATGLNPQAGAYYDLQRIFQSELELAGITPSHGQRLMLIDTSGQKTLGDDIINNIYNITDIGINTSDGEGFGLCQLEHMYTGAPQIVTDVGSYRTFLNDKVAEFIPVKERCYFAGTMPLGFYAPVFSAESVADAMKVCVSGLTEMKKSVAEYNFKSWSTVCDSFLEDVLNMSTSGSALVK